MGLGTQEEGECASYGSGRGAHLASCASWALCACAGVLTTARRPAGQSRPTAAAAAPGAERACSGAHHRARPSIDLHYMIYQIWDKTVFRCMNQLCVVVCRRGCARAASSEALPRLAAGSGAAARPGRSDGERSQGGGGAVSGAGGLLRSTEGTRSMVKR